MEYTEPKTAEMLTKHAVELAVVESNNGGRGFARNVEKQARLMGNNKTVLSGSTKAKAKPYAYLRIARKCKTLPISRAGGRKCGPISTKPLRTI